MPLSKYGIILPVHNGGEYIKICVRSILSQTLADFTLHVLDNFSSDGTTKWIRSVNDDRIRIYSSEKFLSIEESWGRIVSIPKNEFITLIGCDDILDKNYLQTMDELIARHPDASLYQTHFRFIDANGKSVRNCQEMKECFSVNEFLHCVLSNSLDTMGTGYMMRSADFDSLGGFPFYPNLLFADHELWIGLTAIRYLAISKKNCFSFRLHPSTSVLSGAVDYITAFRKFMKYMLVFKKVHPEASKVIEEDIADYILFYCRFLCRRLLKTPAPLRKGITVVQLVEECKQYAHSLSSTSRFDPDADFYIQLAKKIDSNLFTRGLYVFFKKIYKRPVID